MSHSVSVIVPTFNRSALVSGCVRSLLAAGLPDIEIVVADDGSSDDTEAAIRAFGPPVRYIRQQNAGPAAARNLGASIAQGRYLCFLDSDDSWTPGVACRLVGQLDRHEELVVAFSDALIGNADVGYVSFIDRYGGDWFDSLPGTELEPGLKHLAGGPFLERLSRRNVMFLGSLLVRRQGFAQLGGFEAALRGAADWEFFMRCTATVPIGFSTGPALSRYETQQGSMAADADHMEVEFARALECVLEKCTLPTGLRRLLHRRVRDQWFGFAYRAYEQGEYRLARERLVRLSATTALMPRECALLALMSLPEPAVRLVRRLRRRV